MGAVSTEGPQLGGPEEVPPGATFQVTVTNSGRELLNAGLLYDSGVLSGASMPDSGRVQVEVPAMSSRAFTFTVKPGAGASETSLSLDNGAATGWTVRIRSSQDAGTLAPGEVPPPQDGR